MKLQEMVKMRAKKQEVIDYGIDQLVSRLVGMEYMNEDNKGEVIKEIVKSLRYYKTNKLTKENK